MCELQRSLKASQAEQQEALERAAAALTQEQKATQDSLLQVHLLTTPTGLNPTLCGPSGNQDFAADF